MKELITKIQVLTASINNFVVTLPDTTVTAGSYTATNLTVDAKGRITAASSGTGLFTDAGAYTYLTSTTDLFQVGSSASLGASFGVKGQGATSATITFLAQNSAGTTLLKIKDSGVSDVLYGSGSVSTLTDDLNIKASSVGGGVLFKSNGAGAAFVNIRDAGTTDIAITGENSTGTRKYSFNTSAGNSYIKVGGISFGQTTYMSHEVGVKAGFDGDGIIMENQSTGSVEIRDAGSANVAVVGTSTDGTRAFYFNTNPDISYLKVGNFEFRTGDVTITAGALKLSAANTVSVAVAIVSTNKIKINVAGTDYYFLATTTP